MRKLKPQAYLNEFYPSSGMCTKTVINWIKLNKIDGEKTHTGRYLVLIDPKKQQGNVKNIVKMMKAKGM
jgi:hypothetical protein